MSDRSLTDRLIAELEQEANSTRSLLARMPEHQLSWRPHERSMSLGQLALHIAGLPLGIARLLTPPVAEVPDVRYPEAGSREEAQALLNESLDGATERLRSWGDDGLDDAWTMTSDGMTVLESSRYEMVRSLMLNHWYHHRGQMTVYLRMLDVPLPGIYGPTADHDIST